MNHATGPKTVAGQAQGPSVAENRQFAWRTFDPTMLPGGVAAPLAAELVTLRDHRDTLLRDHADEFVMIKGDQIVSYHASRRVAVRAAFQSFGRESVLIQRVAGAEPIRRLGGATG